MEYFIYLPAAGILLLAAFIAVKKLKRTDRQFNHKTPLKIVKKEAENDNPDAILELAYRYAEGYGGCEENEEKAVEWYQKGAKHTGNGAGVLCQAYCYHCGFGVEQDRTESVNLFCKAAELGNEHAQYLAACFTGNITEQVKYLRKAIKLGNENAKTHLADCYLYHGGTAREKAKAVKWFRQAAKQGDVLAQIHLAECYYYGNVVRRNYTETVRWLCKAAEQDSKSAKDSLTMHIGEFRKQAAQGYKPAQEVLKKIEKDFECLWQSGTYEDSTVPDVLSLGYQIDSVYFQTNHENLSVFLKRLENLQFENDASIAVANEEFRGVNCIKLTVKEEIRGISGINTNMSPEDLYNTLKRINAHAATVMYFDIEKNYAIRKIQIDDTLIHLRQILENDLQQDTASGCWYPAAWTYEEYRNDKKALREENTLEVISINKPIDPKRFTLESIEGLKPGTPVIWKLDTPPPGKGKLEWDGKKIFAYGESRENLLLRDIAK